MQKATGNAISNNVVRALSPYQLKTPPTDFIGRTEEISRLVAAIQGGTLVCGVIGMGGVGKTSLALVASEQLKNEYPDGQIYLNLEGVSRKPLTPLEAMAHVVQTYHAEARLPEDNDRAATVYRSILNGKRTLLLMDNVADGAQVEHLIPPKGNILLITSRHHFNLPGIYIVNLGVLPEADACRFLHGITSRVGETAREIAMLCGNLPYALRVAGDNLAGMPHITARNYAARLHEAQGRVELAEPIVNVSYDLLSCDLQKLWRMLSVFPGSFNADAAAAVWNLPSRETEDSLGKLLTRSLLLTEREATDEQTARFRMHDLARDIAANHITVREKLAAGERFSAHYLEVLEDASRLHEDGWERVRHGLGFFQDELRQGIALIADEWHNIAAGQVWAASHTDRITARRLCNQYPKGNLGILTYRLSAHERANWMKQALAASCMLHDRVSEQELLVNLGRYLCASGDIEHGMEMQKCAVQIADELDDKKRQAQAQVGLAASFSQIGQQHDAIILLKQALSNSKFAEDMRGQAVALAKLGQCLRSIGDLQTAKECFRAGVSIGRTSGRKTIEATALVNLGDTYMDSRHARAAILCYRKALSALEATGEKWAESNVLSALWKAHRLMGEEEDAERCFNDAIRVRRENLDIRKGWNDQQGTIDMSISVASMYHEGGRLVEALEWIDHVLLTEDCEDKPAVEAGARLLRGKILRDLDREDEAVGELTEAFNIWERLKNVHWQASAAHDLGYLYQRQYKRLGLQSCLPASESWYRLAASLWESLSEQASLVEANQRLAEVLVRRQRLSQALILCERNEMIAQASGSNLTLAQVLALKSHIFHIAGDLVGARTCAEESVRLFTAEKAYDDITRLEHALFVITTKMKNQSKSP